MQGNGKILITFFLILVNTLLKIFIFFSSYITSDCFSTILYNYVDHDALLIIHILPERAVCFESMEDIH
jgi:hypothetical protein